MNHEHEQGVKTLTGQITKMPEANGQAGLLEGGGWYPRGRSLRNVRVIRDDGVSSCRMRPSMPIQSGFDGPRSIVP